MSNMKINKWLDLKAFSVKIAYLVFGIVICVLFCLILPATIYVSLFVIFLLSVFCIYICLKEIKNRKDRINELSHSVDVVLKESLNVVDIPMVMVNEKSKIIWQNKVSKHTLPEDYILDSANKLLNNKNQKSSILENLNDEVFEAIGSNIRFSDFDCTLISYINKTEESKLKKTLEDTRVAIGVVFIDNFEETFQGLDDIKKAEITSKLVKEIRQWVLENKGVVTKIDKDKFIVFVEKQYVDQMEQNTFEILERVKNISNVTKLPITVSVGISYGEENLDERYNCSSSALDIALGRGGDQAVVKKDKKFDFYGGSNLGIEKTSRVRARTIAHALRELMEKSDKVYIMGHKNSDIDCIGASVGLFKMANLLGKQSNIIVDSRNNTSTKILMNKVKVLNEYENAFLTGTDFNKKQDYSNSLLIVVDTHKKSYLAYPEILDSFDKIVVIDHHRRGPEFIDNALLTYHELYASSTSELVTEILMYLDNVKLTSEEAECLYSGIVVDTKNFMFKTGVKTFEVAAFLKRFGIDLTEVKQLFQSDFETYIAKLEIVKSAEILKGKIAISMCEEEYEDMPVIAAQAADELLSILGIVASFVLCKVDDVVMISGRSMGDINVQTIMEKMGGGGHLTFAGAQLAGITLDDAKTKLIEIIDEYFGKE